MTWEEYLRLNKRQRGDIARKAARGNEGAMRTLISLTRSIATETNDRLRRLERAKLNYGSSYNNVIFFTNTEYDTNRLQMPSALNKDPYAMLLQNEIAYRFLSAKMSTVSGARNAERFRYARLQELNVIPKDTSYRKSQEFLRFLGNEEISAAVDEFGSSDIVIQAMYDRYQQVGINGPTGIGILRQAFTEFLDHRITFDEAMERAGIKIEDYKNRKPTS